MADKDVLYHELLEALHAGGCVLCRQARRASNSYLHALIYEGITDVKLRTALRSSRGLCHRHAWRLAEQRGAILGTAIIYRDVINTLVNSLEARTAASPRWFDRRRSEPGRGLAPTTDCPACELEKDSEQRTARILLRHLEDAPVAEAYDMAGGLCLPHFTFTLSHAGTAATDTLVGWQKTVWTRLRAELDELIRKHDYRFSREPLTGEESTSWQRAVAAVIGEAERHETP